MYALAFANASLTGSTGPGSASGVVSGEFGEVGCEDSALGGFREKESLNGFEGWGLLGFMERKRVGLVEGMVLREEKNEG